MTRCTKSEAYLNELDLIDTGANTPETKFSQLQRPLQPAKGELTASQTASALSTLMGPRKPTKSPNGHSSS